MDLWRVMACAGVAGMGVLAFLTIVRNEMRAKDRQINEHLDAMRERRRRERREAAPREDDAAPLDVAPGGMGDAGGVTVVSPPQPGQNRQ